MKPIDSHTTSFRYLCKVLQQVAETRGKNARIDIYSDYLRQLNDEQSLALAVRFTGEGAFDNVSGKRASVGSRTTATLAAEFCEIDYDMVFKPCRTATGSSSETIEKLMENLDAARIKRKPENLSLSEIESIFNELYKAKGRTEKQAILDSSWRLITPVEIKYFIRMLGQGSLRIGFETRSVISAIAKAFVQDEEQVRFAHMITGSLGRTAILAKNDELDKASFRMFRPLAFMLASPVESRSVESLQLYIAEEKFDGMRCQVHAEGDKIALFSRDLNDVTHSFPEICTFFFERNLPPTVLDGEICVYKDETILPFQLLQKRMGLKKPGKKVLAEFPVLFIAYDLLFLDNKPLFDVPLSMRRKFLEELANEKVLPLTAQFEIESETAVETLFNKALAHGNEGLMLKLKESTYEYGQRKKSWLKVKKPGGSLDTVILYAHAGSGKRGGTYSDFTLGISVKDDERYEEEFIPIGKAYGGYTDAELSRMNSRIKELILDRFGPTLLLRPELVVEIEFDDIQVNKRTKAGYTLRFPRFRTIRWDLAPKDCDTLKDVEYQYKKKLETERLKQDLNPSFIMGKNRTI